LSCPKEQNVRLYSRTGAVSITDSGKTYKAGKDGAFDLPDELAARQHAFATAGKPQWETDIERQNRLIAEEIERRKDPATLLDAVQQIVKAAQAVAPPEPAPAPAPAKAEARTPAKAK
jgi:hypothetical protein